VKLLVLGGTLFLGRHIVEAAVARGHEVTIFNRGQTNPGLHPDVERLRGDRDGDLDALAGRRWEAVVDTSASLPRWVRATADVLAGQIEHYTFVSSGSVYAEPMVVGTDESAPTTTLADESVEEVTDETYGGLKALCERIAEDVLPGCVLSVRAGLVVGPYDPTGRFTYWVDRIARGGEVLAPEPRDQPVQLIDARDLAGWILQRAESRRVGTFNATGPAKPLTMESLLEQIVRTTGSDARLVWVDEDFLLRSGVEVWSDLPLWLAPSAHPELAGFLSMDVSKAVAAGLRFRPFPETITDALDRAEPVSGAGLAAARERELLQTWKAHAAT
jgi:2'-hydroxyisoflavone reductase